MSEKLIYIADNQDLTREGIISYVKKFFNDEVTIEVMSYKEELISKVSTHQPFLLIIDHASFEWNSPDDYLLLRKAAPNTAILVISDVFTYHQAREVIDAGISHFILKTSTEEEFLNALKSVVNRKKFISSEIYDILIQKEQSARYPAVPVKLSPAEIDVARMIAEGKTTKEIANLKHLSFHTVNTHRKNIFRKLNINTSFELVKYVMNAGLSTDIEYHI
jgi:DNA-binding NarL/FixJ family response regulator